MRVKDLVGRHGEELAARHLQEAGFAVLVRNWRCDIGEIDIVARDEQTLVVCEVKTRSGVMFGTPLEAVTAEKAARLRRLAARFLAAHDLRPRAVRIDVVGVLRRGSAPAQIEHVRGIDG